VNTKPLIPSCRDVRGVWDRASVTCDSVTSLLRISHRKSHHITPGKHKEFHGENDDAL